MAWHRKGIRKIRLFLLWKSPRLTLISSSPCQKKPEKNLLKSYKEFLQASRTIFEENDSVSSFDDRENKDYFYIKFDSNEVIDGDLLNNIYYFEDDNLVPVRNEALIRAIRDYIEKRDLLEQVKNKDAKKLIINVLKKNLFQAKAIISLISKIYRNRMISKSKISNGSKTELRDKILFIGKQGCDRKRIIANI